MERVTVTIEPDLLAAVDAMAAARGYVGRSEAVRDLLRRGLAEDAGQHEPQTPCIATLTFVAEHAIRDLPQRIAETQSRHHDLVVTQNQVPLDHDATLHMLVLRGPLVEVRDMADALTTQRGVRHGRLAVIPATITAEVHQHGHKARRHEHIAT